MLVSFTNTTIRNKSQITVLIQYKFSKKVPKETNDTVSKKIFKNLTAYKSKRVSDVEYDYYAIKPSKFYNVPDKNKFDEISGTLHTNGVEKGISSTIIRRICFMVQQATFQFKSYTFNWVSNNNENIILKTVSTFITNSNTGSTPNQSFNIKLAPVNTGDLLISETWLQLKDFWFLRFKTQYTMRDYNSLKNKFIWCDIRATLSNNTKKLITIQPEVYLNSDNKFQAYLLVGFGSGNYRYLLPAIMPNSPAWNEAGNWDKTQAANFSIFGNQSFVPISLDDAPINPSAIIIVNSKFLIECLLNLKLYSEWVTDTYVGYTKISSRWHPTSCPKLSIHNSKVGATFALNSSTWDSLNIELGMHPALEMRLAQRSVWHPAYSTHTKRS